MPSAISKLLLASALLVFAGVNALPPAQAGLHADQQCDPTNTACIEADCNEVTSCQIDIMIGCPPDPSSYVFDPVDSVNGCLTHL